MGQRRGLPTREDFGARSHSVRSGCLRFAVEVTRHHARLASGCWPSSTGRDWLPAGFLQKVSRLWRSSSSELLGAMSRFFCVATAHDARRAKRATVPQGPLTKSLAFCASISSRWPPGTPPARRSGAGGRRVDRSVVFAMPVYALLPIPREGSMPPRPVYQGAPGTGRTSWHGGTTVRPLDPTWPLRIAPGACYNTFRFRQKRNGASRSGPILRSTSIGARRPQPVQSSSRRAHHGERRDDTGDHHHRLPARQGPARRAQRTGSARQRPGGTVPRPWEGGRRGRDGPPQPDPGSDAAVRRHAARRLHDPGHPLHGPRHQLQPPELWPERDARPHAAVRRGDDGRGQRPDGPADPGRRSWREQRPAADPRLRPALERLDAEADDGHPD